jgi:hypothetical protein
MDANIEFEQMKEQIQVLETRVKELEASDKKRKIHWPKDDEVDRLFEELVEGITPSSLQMLIRYTSLESWAKASVGLPLASVVKIKNNISRRAWGTFVDYARESEFHLWTHADRFRKELLEATDKLTTMGEIVLGWDIRPIDEAFLKPLKRIEMSSDNTMTQRPTVDPEVKAWLEGTLEEANNTPLERPALDDWIKV